MIEPGEPMLEVVDMEVLYYVPWNGFNSNWDVISAIHDGHYYEPYSGNMYLNYKFVFKRRSQYFLLNLFGPVILLTLLQLFGFLISPDTVERTLYSATIMLAMFVLHDQILSYLPQTPQPIIVAYYVIAVMSFGTFCTFYAAFLFWIISISNVLHKQVTKWKFQLYNVVDSICFVSLLVCVCLGNSYCWLKNDSQ